jgi:hypothetical protein
MLTCVAAKDDVVEGEGVALKVAERENASVPLMDAVGELDVEPEPLKLGAAVCVTLLEPVTEPVALADARRLLLAELDCIGMRPNEGKRHSRCPEQRTRPREHAVKPLTIGKMLVSDACGHDQDNAW